MAKQTGSVDIDGIQVFLKKHHLAKYIKLRVKAADKAEVVAPIRASFKDMASFAMANKEWLLQTVSKIKTKDKSSEDFERILGGRYGVILHKLKGVRHKAILLCSVRIDSFIFKNKFANCILASESSKSIKGVIIASDETALKNLKKSIAKAVFGLSFIRLKPFVQGRVNSIKIKQMRTRWGSCNSKKGYINLSLELLSRSFSQIEYVVLHELTHLNHPHHRPSFYLALAKVMPDYMEKERLLKTKNL